MTESLTAPTLRQRLLFGGIWAVGGKIVTTGAALIGNALLARLLFPDELGAYFLAFSIVSLCVNIGALGLTQVVVRFVAESMGLQQFGRTRHVVIMVFALGGLGALSVALVYLLFGDFLGENLFHAPALAAVTGLVAGWIIVTTLQNLVVETFRGFHDIRLATAFGTLSPTGGGGLVTAFLLTGSLSLLWVLKGETTLASVLLIAIGAGSVNVLLAGWILYRKVQSLPAQDVKSAEARLNLGETLRAAWPLLMINLSVLLLTQADVWLLGVFRSQEEVAIYGVASRMAVATMLVNSILYVILPPLIAEKYATGEIAILERLLRAGATITAVIAFPLFATFILIPDEILTIVYGSYYEGAAWILRLLSLGLFVNVATGMRGYVLMMTGYGRLEMVLSLAGGAVNILLCTLGAVFWGIHGVALAAMSATILQCLMELVAVRMRLGIWTYASLNSLRDIRRLLASHMRARRKS
jgi:O-antigen/teichoic acid export membrane protein